MGQSFLAGEQRPIAARLWIQAPAEASEDRQIARYMRRHMREVHAYVADVLERAREAGGLSPEHDPAAEAWIFLALGLLSMADRALGGVMDDAWPAIRTA